MHGDEAVRVAGVSDNDDADIFRGGLLDRLAGAGEDRAVDADEVAALHAFLAGDAADAEDPVAVAEGFFEVVAADLLDAGESVEGAVLEFHLNAVERLQDGRNFDEVDDDGLIGSEDLAAGKAERECITNVAGRAGDRHANRSLHRISSGSNVE